MRPVFAIRSCQTISDQKLQRSVKADMWQGKRHAFRSPFQFRRPEAHKTKRSGRFRRSAFFEDLPWLFGQIPRKDRCLGIAVKNFVVDAFALYRRADDDG